MTTDSEIVEYQVVDGVATIRLNRPASLNAMNKGLMLGLTTSLQSVVDDKTVRVVVLTGSGKGFCSGADLSSPPGAGKSGTGTGDSVATQMDEVFHPAIRLLATLPVPTVARVNGVAAGGGLGLALGCDIVIAARSARFVCTFGPRLGIVPDLGTTFHLTHLVGKARARAIAMLGDPISADQAVEWGLIWSAVDDTELDAEVQAVANRLAKSSPKAMSRIRQSIEAAEINSLSSQLDLEREHQRVLVPLNMGEGAAAFMQKREPDFRASRD